MDDKKAGAGVEHLEFVVFHPFQCLVPGFVEQYGDAFFTADFDVPLIGGYYIAADVGRGWWSRCDAAADALQTDAVLAADAKNKEVGVGFDDGADFDLGSVVQHNPSATFRAVEFDTIHGHIGVEGYLAGGIFAGGRYYAGEHTGVVSGGIVYEVIGAGLQTVEKFGSFVCAEAVGVGESEREFHFFLFTGAAVQ